MSSSPKKKKMVALFFSQEQELQLQNPIFDGLYCDEERFDDVFEGGFSFGDEINEDRGDYNKKQLTLLENDLFWEDDELVNLLSKENESTTTTTLFSDESLMVARKSAVRWILSVIAHYGFTAKTAVLAVNYYDRFISSICFQRDKPWMSQLASVACLSIAAKVEEVQVPLLLDLQVEDSKYVFEAKTIQRMELLLLSTLQWKMKLVTPISFFDHIVRRFRLTTNLDLEVLNRCEQLLLSIITDTRLMLYLPSVIATATILFAIKDFEPSEVMQYEILVMNALKVSKEKVNECYGIIIEVMMENEGLNKQHNGTRKRKLLQSVVPGSPDGVMDACFSCENSNDSWDLAMSVTTTSSKPLLKRSRVTFKIS